MSDTPVNPHGYTFYGRYPDTGDDDTFDFSGINTDEETDGGVFFPDIDFAIETVSGIEGLDADRAQAYVTPTFTALGFYDALDFATSDFDFII